MKIALFANSDWYLYNFRLPLARSLRSRGDEVVLISPSGPYGPKMIEEGFRWIDFPLSRMGINPLAELHTISRLMMVYRRERPDIAHHFTIKCVLYGGLAARGAGGFATVSSLTGLGHLFTSNTLRARISRPFAKMIYRRVLERSTVIFQNPDDARDFASIGLVRDGRSRVIRGSGVDLVRFRPLENKVNGSGETVLLVGRLISEKGIGEFVEAARIVR